MPLEKRLVQNGKIPEHGDPLRRPPEKKGPPRPMPGKEKPSDPQKDLPPT